MDDHQMLKFIGDLIAGGGWAGLAAVLLWYVLSRTRVQDAKLELQSETIGVLRTELDELKTTKLTLLKQRLQESERAEHELAKAVEKIGDQAERLGMCITKLDDSVVRLAAIVEHRPCQLPERIQRKIREELEKGEIA